ncbi:claudin-10-like [Ctenopharyngodon idella]|uniref:claudin-10-like n=1 Tax=Ctenopharyngodon idella TaxID=7959 RepID=UPI00222FA41F|nr:claudin-10-like [Ctenopharyngodon idella]
MKPGSMRQRTVVMYVEIGCFLSCLCGWILICSTLATEYWCFSEVSSVVLTTGNYYSNLWMDCVSDTTGVSDCKYYPSMMDLSVFLHVCRALAVVSVIFGFWGAVLALIGMKCTKIGGSELANARVTFAAALTFMASGFCGMIVYSWWGDKVRSDFVDPYYLQTKFELGAALFIGWGGSCLVICGSAVMCYFSGKESFPKRSGPSHSINIRYVKTSKIMKKILLKRNEYVVKLIPFFPPLRLNKQPRKPPTYMTARTRQTYMLPGSRPTTVIIPPSHQSYSESRGSRESRGRTGTQTSQFSRTVRPIRPPIDSNV